MTDTLRTRIACVLAGITPNNTPKPEYLEMADAVIRELGLSEETRDGYTITNGLKDIIRRRKPHYRYVTDWKADDE